MIGREQIFFRLEPRQIRANVPEHVEKAVPRLCHAVVIHIERDQAGVLVGDFERWEGWSVGAAQQPESKE